MALSRPIVLSWLLSSGMIVAQAAPRQLEEVLVTAQKRVESLSDVPVSVTAVSAEKLNQAGIENLADLSEYTPNFKMVKGGWPPTFICGVLVLARTWALRCRWVFSPTVST